MKAAMNGALNLSVLDGWWGEGYDDSGDVLNGWAIKPAPGHLDEAQRDAEEARTLYELLQDQVIPTYYRTGPMGYSPEWVAMSKRSIATISPRFNVIRMVAEYVKKFYAPAAMHGRRYRRRRFCRRPHRGRLEGPGPQPPGPASACTASTPRNAACPSASR
jgi:starch phosphorylase